MKTKELIAEAISLPVEDRLMLIDTLLSSLNMAESVLDKRWHEVAKNRLQQLQAGEITPVTSEDVFKKIATRF